MLAVTLDLLGPQSIVGVGHPISGELNTNVSNDFNDNAPRFQSEMSFDVNPTDPLNIAGFSHTAILASLGHVRGENGMFLLIHRHEVQSMLLDETSSFSILGRVIS